MFESVADRSILDKKSSYICHRLGIYSSQKLYHGNQKGYVDRAISIYSTLVTPKVEKTAV